MQSSVRILRMRLSQGQLFWREMGLEKDTAIIFLHGAYGEGSEWLPVVEPLQEDYHCFVPDMLGFGDSEHPNVHHSITLHTECLGEYIQALRLEKVYLVAHSLGAWVAANYAINHPEQVQGLVLVSPEGLDIGDKQRWKTETLLVSKLPFYYWGLKLMAPILRLLGKGEELNQLLQYRKQLLQCPTSCELLFKRRNSEIESEYLNLSLEQLKTPLLVLQGKQDTPAKVKQSQLYRKTVSQGKLRLLEQGKGDMLTAWPQDIAQEIRQLIHWVSLSSPSLR
ncbi:alpha/beta hydrolase [Spirulina sp. CS-785/01]|uniref:alpha/beta fold hydrolase n=1 Tax=Spirulina sp. CS-785/01 TaxID=3021716 RepID=UPI00232ECD93|nr:alpha/beta hydrolase [Spirulina sp. CS-785/01]MDB9315228.1 alpha/beta hydrolase [Spirulina sp. CS-785/01]